MKDSTKQILNLTQLSFHQIRKNEITQVSGFWGRDTRRIPNSRSGHATKPPPPCEGRTETYFRLASALYSLPLQGGGEAKQQHGRLRPQFLPCRPQPQRGGRGERCGEPCRSFSFSLCPQRAHLGQGTRTNIYDGVLNVCSTAGADDEAEYFSSEPNNNSRELHVVLKVLDPSHRDIALVSPAILLRVAPGPWAARWCSPAS